MDYCCFGSGSRNFVIIPGLSTGPITPMEEAIAAQYAIFTDEFTVYLFDRRNELPDNYSMETMAEDTVAAIKQLGLTDICLYGSSQGGMIAQLMAETHPDLIEKLIIASSAATCNDTGKSIIDNWIDIAKTGDGVALNAAMIDKVYSPAFIEKYKDLMEACKAPMTEAALKRFITLAGSVLTFHHIDDLSKICCDVFVIGCEGDQIFTHQPTLDMAKKLGCNCHIYGPEYGHAAYDEAPDCVGRVFEFVNTLHL